MTLRCLRIRVMRRVGRRSYCLLLLTFLAAVALMWFNSSGTWMPFNFEFGFDSDLAAHREAVKEMTKFAWRRYADACGHTGGNELAPATNSCASQPDELVGPRLLLTAVDSLDTLSLMQLQDEFNEASALVARLFRPRFATNMRVSVFETTIRTLGGLLGAYSLTEDHKFVLMATEMADGLAGAFADPDRMSRQSVRLFLNPKETPVVASAAKEDAETLLLAEVGTLYLEFTYLSHISGNRKYAEWARGNQERLMRLNSSCGLYPSHFGPRGQVRSSSRFSVGGGSDSFYEYLLKRCLYDKQPDKHCRQAYTKSLDSIMAHLTVRIPAAGGLACVGNAEKSCGSLKQADCSMEHLTCFLGGTYALAYLENPHRNDWLQFAENVTRTCYLSYSMSPTGLGPEMFAVSNNGTLLLKSGWDFYLLRPETVESIYYLYYVTGRQVYRDWGWQIALAINATTRSPQGFSGVKNMMAARQQSDNQQQSYFLAETLKYLYLLFSPKDTLRLDQWLFTTEAHILPTRNNPLRNRMTE